MTNTRVGILIGSGVVTGIALLYAAKTRTRNRSLLVRARKQAMLLRRQAADLIDKGLEEANRKSKRLVNVVERVAG